MKRSTELPLSLCNTQNKLGIHRRIICYYIRTNLFYQRWGRSVISTQTYVVVCVTMHFSMLLCRQLAIFLTLQLACHFVQIFHTFSGKCENARALPLLPTVWQQQPACEVSNSGNDSNGVNMSSTGGISRSYGKMQQQKRA